MHRGFTRGMGQVPMAKSEEIRRKLRSIIGGQTRSKMSYWLNGATIIQPDSARKIERLFNRYGITDIWDE